MSDVYTTSGERLPGAQTTAVTAEPISATPPYKPEEIAKQYENVGAAKKAELLKKQELTEETRAQARGIEQEYKPQLAEAAKTPEFKPSQATAGELAALFGMIGAMGVLGGKGSYASALGAMNAMGGMLKGYNQGRKDLFDQEKAIYDKKIQENKLHFDRINQAYERALKAAPNNLSDAQSKLERELTSLGANVLSQQAKLEGMSKSYEMWRLARNTYDSKLSTSAPVSIIGPDGKPQLITRQEFQRRTAAGETVTPAPRSGTTAGGQIQFRYNQAVQDAAVSAAMEINNFADLPLRSVPPALAEVITNPSKGLSDAAKAYFSQSITKAEDRAQQQVSAGLIRQVATISASGRPGGVTEAAIKEYQKMLPKAGDKKINTFLFLGMMRQEMEVAVKHLQGAQANPEQISQAIAARNAVNKTVPFTTSDILRIMRQGGPALSDKQTQTIISQAAKIDEFEKSIRAITTPKAPQPSAAPSVPTTTQALPAGIPDGSVLVGTTADGITPVYQAPNGKKYTPEGQ